MNKEDRPIGIELIRIALRHKKTIGLLVGIAVLSSIIFTSPFFLKPQFKAETTIFPTAANTSINLLNSDMRFGSETEINNEIQILHSNILRDSLIKKFDLFRHYNIDTTSPDKIYYFNKKFNSNVKTDQTRYNSIEVSVYDEDPAFAQKIANEIVTMGDRVKSGIIKKNLKNAYDLISEELNSKTKEISELGDTINRLRHQNYDDAIGLKSNHFNSTKNTVDDLRNALAKIRTDEGVYNTENQFNSIYKSYLKANAVYLTDSGMLAIMKKHLKENDTAMVKKEAEYEGSRILVGQLRAQLAKLSRTDNKYNTLFDNYNYEKGILGELKSQYEIEASTFEKEYPNLRLETLKSKYTAELQLYNNIKARYELALSNLTDQVPSAYVVSPADIPTRKVSPQRLLITVVTAISVFALSVLAYFLMSYARQISGMLKD